MIDFDEGCPNKTYPMLSVFKCNLVLIYMVCESNFITNLGDYYLRRHLTNINFTKFVSFNVKNNRMDKTRSNQTCEHKTYIQGLYKLLSHKIHVGVEFLPTFCYCVIKKLFV